MAAPLRSLGLRLLRKQQQAVLVYPGIGTYICKSKQLFPGSGAMSLQGSLSCSFDEIAIAPLSHIAKFVNKRTMHHLIGCPSISVKSPSFRKVHTPKCSLSNCLPPTSKISRHGVKTRPLIQKASTSSSPSQATIHTTTRLEKTDAQMDKPQEEFMSKLWAAILKRVEEKLIDGALLVVGTFLLGVGCTCILFFSDAFDIDIGMKDEEKLSDEENSEALKALGDILKRKDKHTQAYKKQADNLLKRNDALLKHNDTLLKGYDILLKHSDTLLKRNDFLSNLVDLQHKIIVNLLDMIEQGEESPKKDDD